MGYVINRPETAAMERLLAQNPDNAVGTILRLAWLEGLTRDEIVLLQWTQLRQEKEEIILPDRTVPLFGDMAACLSARRERYFQTSPYVVISEKFQKPLKPESLSRLVRQAMDSAGMSNVRLSDLRHDFIIRRLETDDWAFVARISGISVTTLQSTYAEYIRVRASAERLSDGDNEYRVWQILQAEKDSVEGLVISMRWYMGLTLREMVTLTWDQVDFDGNVLHRSAGDAELPQSVRERLLTEKGRRGADEDPHILLTERSRKPMEPSYLSKRVRTMLIRGGVEKMMLRDFYSTSEKDLDKLKILALARSKNGLLRSDVMEQLNLTGPLAHRRLREMTDRHELVRVCSKYYLPGTVVPPEEQESVIREYLVKHGQATMDDLYYLLKLERRQCSRVLRKLVQEGKLLEEDGLFLLPRKAAGGQEIA